MMRALSIFAAVAMILLSNGCDVEEVHITSETKRQSTTPVMLPQSLPMTAYLGGDLHGFGVRKLLSENGEKAVRILVEYEGKPAADVNVALFLNGTVWTPVTKTDSQGIASWYLPDQSWSADMVQAGWNGQYDSKFFLFTGRETPLKSKYGSGKTPIRDDGVPLTLGESNVAPSLVLSINRAIKIFWPSGAEAEAANVEHDVIRWNSAYGADKYLLMVWYYIEGAKNNSYELAAEIVTDKTEFPLSEFQYESSNKSHKYFIEVRGFSNDGRAVALSTMASIDGGVPLSLDGQKIVGGFFDFGCK